MQSKVHKMLAWHTLISWSIFIITVFLALLIIESQYAFLFIIMGQFIFIKVFVVQLVIALFLNAYCRINGSLAFFLGFLAGYITLILTLWGNLPLETEIIRMHSKEGFWVGAAQYIFASLTMTVITRIRLKKLTS